MLRSLVIAIALFGFSCSEPANKIKPFPKPGEKTTDTRDVNLNFSPMLDILFVIDDSGSMGTYQSNLANNVMQFAGKIIKNQILDFHIGVVTSDMRNPHRSGALYGNPIYVDKNTTNLLPVLRNNLRPGSNGPATEYFFDPIITALSEPHLSGVNAGFYREDAFLAVIFLTDSYDQGRYTAQYLYDFLTQLKNGDTDKFVGYGAIIEQSSPGCSREEKPPVKIVQFLNMFPGTLQLSLCDVDFGNKLATIGDDLLSRIEFFLPLNEIPAAGTIEVRYGSFVMPNDINEGWIYDPERVGIIISKDVKIPRNMPPGAKLEISYVKADL